MDWLFQGKYRSKNNHVNHVYPWPRPDLTGPYLQHLFEAPYREDKLFHRSRARAGLSKNSSTNYVI